MKKNLSILLLATMLLISCEESKIDKEPPLWKAPAFSLVDQNGATFTSDTLKGKVWIATLFFSTCNGPCPMMAMRLAELQEAVNRPDLMIISISCDPEHDTPQMLQQYAQRNQADPKRWIFLTGKLDEVKAVADGLKLGFEPALKDIPITHSTQFLLIDQNGNVRGVYNHDDEESLKQLKADSAKLAG